MWLSSGLYLNLTTTGGGVQAAFPKSQTSLWKKPFPLGPISHFPIIWTLSLKTDVVFQKSFSQGPHSFLKYQSLRLSFPLSRQQLCTGAKWQGKKLVFIIGLAKIKGIFGCKSAKLWYIASFIPQKRGPLVFTLSCLSEFLSSCLWWLKIKWNMATAPLSSGTYVAAWTQS